MQHVINFRQSIVLHVLTEILLSILSLFHTIRGSIASYKPAIITYREEKRRKWTVDL